VFPNRSIADVCKHLKGSVVMSRGPGRVVRAIEGVFAAESDNAFTTAELCERVYRNEAIVKKHSPPRATQGLREKSTPRPELGVWGDDGRSARKSNPFRVSSAATGSWKSPPQATMRVTFGPGFVGIFALSIVP
jgi:hypothetical protein